MARDRGTGSLRLRGGIYQGRYWHNGQKIEESTHTSDLGKAKTSQEASQDGGTTAFVGPQAGGAFADLKAGILHDTPSRRRTAHQARGTGAQAPRGHLGLDKALAIAARIDLHRHPAPRGVRRDRQPQLRRWRAFRLAVGSSSSPAPGVSLLQRTTSASFGMADFARSVAPADAGSPALPMRSSSPPTLRPEKPGSTGRGSRSRSRTAW
jgi:hypothetical protein